MQHLPLDECVPRDHTKRLQRDAWPGYSHVVLMLLVLASAQVPKEHTRRRRERWTQ